MSERTCHDCGDLEPACNFLWARCNELEQLVKEMWLWNKDCLEFVETYGDKYIKNGHYYITESWHEQLEALGVSIDD